MTLRAIQGLDRPLTQTLQGVVRSAFPVIQAKNDASYMASALSGLSKGFTLYYQLAGGDVANQALQTARAVSSYQLRSFDIDFSQVYRSVSTLSGVLQQSTGLNTASHTQALLQNVARSITADLNVYGLQFSVLNLARELQRAQSLNRLPRDWIITTPSRVPTVSPEYEAEDLESETGADIFVPFSDLETTTDHAPGTSIRNIAGSLQSWVRENHRELNLGFIAIQTGVTVTSTESATACVVMGATGLIVTIWLYKLD
jgi:hypothetical protein